MIYELELVFPMNHTLDKLDECVFDYLALNMDKPVSVVKIFADIRCNTGHRCDELTNGYDDWIYFLSVCYCLDATYDVTKLHLDGKLHLVLQKDKDNLSIVRSGYDESSYNNTYWNDGYNFPKIIDHICKNGKIYSFNNEYYAKLFNASDTLLHLLVRCDKYDELTELLNTKMVNTDAKNAFGYPLLDFAMSLRKLDIIALLVDYEKRNYDMNNTFVGIVPVDANIESRGAMYGRYIVYACGVWYISVNMYIILLYIYKLSSYFLICKFISPLGR